LERFQPPNTIVEGFLSNELSNPETEVYLFLDGNEVHSRNLQDLSVRSKSIAAYLQQNFKKGDRALLLYPPGLDFLDAYWACMISGIIGVPVPMVPNPEEVRNFVHATQVDCSASVMLCNSIVKSIVDYQLGLNPETAVPDAIICTDEIELSNASLFIQHNVTPEDIAFLQYTSNSKRSDGQA